ncbi:MAG: DUF120 domain-containing protein, partial [Smithellaceae bacterium]|nr:DUF120 domain-containing protein [Smithellaceae bacterium]
KICRGGLGGGYKEKLGFKPYPGTLNLEIENGSCSSLQCLRQEEGIELLPPDPNYCRARTIRVMVGNVEGALIIPAEEVNVHGENIVEIMAPVHIKTTLGLHDGDLLTISYALAGRNSSSPWQIYVGKIPYRESGSFWVSFESDPTLKQNKDNIYGKCLPCIQSLYDQLREGSDSITLTSAYNCWKVTAVVSSLDDCLSLLSEYEKRFPGGHVYGKFGTSLSDAPTRVVVFHTENEEERDRLHKALTECLTVVDPLGKVEISRACAILYHDLLGPWQNWRSVSPVLHPEKVGTIRERIKEMLYRSGL